MEPPKKKKSGRTKSTDNARVVELRKERSRDAARNRRGKENAQFDELARLLPLPAAITSQLDKASIVRLTISYLSMREFAGNSPKKLDTAFLSREGLDAGLGNTDGSSSSKEVVAYNSNAQSSSMPEETGNQLLQAMDGFLMVLSQEGKILYISETVSVNLGLSQVELTGNNVYHYVHPEDQTDLANQLYEIEILASDVDAHQQAPGSPYFQDNSPSPTDTKSFFMRMKCTLVRRGGSYTKSSGFKVIHCVGRLKKYALDNESTHRKAFVMVCQSVMSMNINELPLECNMFVSRVNMDLKIVYCEGRIHKFMDYFAKDIVGISAYDFYHAGDVAVIQGHHAKFLAKGQIMTKYYRWMNKNGGWVWMQTKCSLIPHPSNPELKQMLCLNYILSEVEHRSIVLGMAQLHGKPQLASAEHNITEITTEVVDSNTDEEMKDALIDDQVMVFPKWHATSDKLVPERTLLDQMALQRTGYETGIEQIFPPSTWQKSQDISPTNAMVSDSEIDDKELQDIAEIINSDLTDFDRKLLDYVAAGGIDNFQTKPEYLNPIGAYIEEIPQDTPTITLSRAGLVVPKVEEGLYSSGASACAQVTNSSGMHENVYESFAIGTSTAQRSNTLKRSGVPMNSDMSLSCSFPEKIPRLSHSPVMYTEDSGSSRRSPFPLQQPPVRLDTQSYARNSSSPCSVGVSKPPQYQAMNPNNAPRFTQTTAVSSNTSSYGENSGETGTSTNQGLTGQTQSSAGSKSLVTRKKPQSLLEQLIQMPNTSSNSDEYNDELIFDIFEELLNEGDSRRTCQDKSSIANSLPVPVQEIKQEVVTPTAPEPSVSFSKCFNIPQHQNSRQSSPSIPMSNNTSTSQQWANNNWQQEGIQTQQQQQERQQLQRRQLLQQQQQQKPKQLLPQRVQQQQYLPRQQVWQQQQPVASPQGLNPLQTYPQQQQPHPPYTQPRQPSQQLQQPPEAYQQRYQQNPRSGQTQQGFGNDLLSLLQRKGDTGFSGQRNISISTAPLPDLGNGLDEELNKLPMAITSLANQIIDNGSTIAGENPSSELNNYTGMM
ncbi:protein similar isoform X2 [Nematostella vectensis]|uniref:protein similar isoform X2 n=1 Tax=Nematostella vectensis TaxID=45351 RepID=UPI001390517E|nr:protein similar isoform X2 [Nematostella vectensis]